MKLLDYHRLKAAALEEGRDAASLESAVRAERADFSELVHSLLPPQDEKYLSRYGWPNYEKFHTVCELYSEGSTSQQEYMRRQINQTRGYQLSLFRVEAKERAVAMRSSALLRLALVALALEDLNCGDARDAILALGSLLKAAREIEGLDWSAMVCGVAVIAGPGVEPLMLDFLANHPS